MEFFKNMPRTPLFMLAIGITLTALAFIAGFAGLISAPAALTIGISGFITSAISSLVCLGAPAKRYWENSYSTTLSSSTDQAPVPTFVPPGSQSSPHTTLHHTSQDEQTPLITNNTAHSSPSL